MKFTMNQQELFDKLFILGFVWMTPMSLLGILRSSLMWVLVNGIEVDIPLREYEESVGSNEHSEAIATEDEESQEEVQGEEEEVQSKSQGEEEELLQYESKSSIWKLKD